MPSFSHLGIGLGFLFGFVVVAFVAELYYLLWWKKKREDIENQDSSSSNNTPTHLSCFKTPYSSRIPKIHQKDLQNCNDESENQEKQQEPTQKDLPIKGFGEESLDLELMRLHNLCGPPRFLFTINEETKEDLELESRKGSTNMTLSELLCTPETPISSSSPLKMAQASNLEGYLNPLYDNYESNELDFNKIRSSPPPTFKFLRDAEEKLLKRLMQLEAEKRESLKKNQDADFLMRTKEKDGCFSKLGDNNGKSEDGIHHHHHQMSTPSQVLPLASSPSN
ncbi:hypothetical protein SSX86_015291 [Deinandra increscens subsp. villosa]|uniref:Uncharacterized protein n=1 Tax=Deinandra increscens subsp. villosa TaxID=3103831 RepID=A0AAP0D731_9ASTR